MLLPLVALSLLALQEVEAPPELPPSTFPREEEAFAEFVENNWEGGYKDLGVELQKWIRKCAMAHK